MTQHARFGASYDLKMHLVLVTKYRRKVISAPILKRLEEILRSTCQKWEVSLLEFNGESDHVHLLIDYHPNIQISKFVNNLKTVSSRLIRRDFGQELAKTYRNKPVFWTGAYYVGSCGSVTLDQLKRYVENQHAPS